MNNITSHTNVLQKCAIRNPFTQNVYNQTPYANFEWNTYPCAVWQLFYFLRRRRLLKKFNAKCMLIFVILILFVSFSWFVWQWCPKTSCLFNLVHSYISFKFLHTMRLDLKHAPKYIRFSKYNDFTVNIFSLYHSQCLCLPFVDTMYQ